MVVLACLAAVAAVVTPLCVIYTQNPKPLGSILICKELAWQKLNFTEGQEKGETEASLN